MEISRRGFLKLSGIFGAASALPACARKPLLTPSEDPPPRWGREDFAASVCGLCPAGCGLKVRRVDGRAVGVAGDPAHPINQGVLCPKGPALLQELYHPDRVKSPLARDGERGSGRWSQISWEQAFRRVGEKLLEAKAKRPSLAVLSDPGDWDAGRSLLPALAEALGGRAYAAGAREGDRPVEAYEALHETPDLYCDPAQARLLVSFGFDWLQAHREHVQAQLLWARLRSREGVRAHVVAVEPRFSVTAGKADSWLPVLPGTEGLLALAAAREMIESRRLDQAFLRARCSGFDDFRRAVEPFTAERAAKAADLPEKEIRVLSAKFLNARPAVALGGRSELSAQMAVHALNALTGSLGDAKIFSVGAPAGVSWPERPEQEPPPGALLVDRVNPLFLAPRRWREVFARTPFIATVSSHLSETAEFSDIVLPSCTPLEELHASRRRRLDGRAVLGSTGRAVEPLYGAKDAGEIFLRLARDARAAGLPSGDYAGFLAARLRELGGGPFPEAGASRWTELSRARGAAPARFDFKPLVSALPGLERRLLAPRDAEFPLSLCVFTPLAFSCGEGAHLPFLQGVAGVQTSEMWESWAELHPRTAAAAGIDDGRKAWVVSRGGRIKVKARVLSSAMPGVVAVPRGLGHTAYGRWAKAVGSNPMEIADAFEGTGVRLERA